MRNTPAAASASIWAWLVSTKPLLKSSCPGLGWDRAITYETSIDQLCTQQIVYALRTTGGTLQRGAGCSLGEFVPVEYVKTSKD